MHEPLAVRLRAIFAEELEEQLTQMHAALASLQRDPADREQLRAIFRVMHTLKGASRAAGVPLIEQVSHALEGELARARDTGAALDAAQLALLLEAADAFGGARERLNSGQPVDSAALSGVLQRVRRGGSGARSAPTPTSTPAIAARAAAVPEAPIAVPIQETTPSPSALPTVADDRAVRDEHVRIGVMQADAITAAAGEIAVLSGALADHAAAVRALRAQLRAHMRSSDADEQQALDRELARLVQQSGDDARSLATISGRLEGPLRHLRQRPVRDLTDTLERMARDVARDVGKQIVVTTEGEAVEADRVVIEALREPLLHLIRNAVDHGIEAPAVRVAAGKPPEGNLRIEVSMHGDRIRLTVADDGAGLDLAAISRAMARHGRVVPTEQTALANAIFDDGFSTRESATTLSGRGVGLGIVRATAERLGGSADVQSVAGRGTTFVLDVPVSIATVRALLVVVGGVILAIPSGFVNRVISAQAKALQHVDGRDVMIVDGPPLPVLPLASLIGAPYRSGAWGDRVQGVVIEGSGHRVAVTVDDLLDERELVMRPLEHVSAETSAATVGAALIGTGDLVLVLSGPFLLAEASRVAGSLSASSLPKRKAAPRPRILVVDDSITSRTLEQSVLSAAGYDVTTAVDGLEAWRAIERASFALVVSDVEMPHLDGIGLCERIRANPGTSSLPVILVTSLDEPAHRARGLEAGADAYVAKSSFDQDQLLDTVRMLIGRQGDDQ
ncbi:MAG: response regulator [bacterium]